MRLIDADQLESALADKLEWLMGYGDGVYLAAGKDIHNVINSRPTAYDVDKVITKLEEIEEIMTSAVSQDCFGEECKVSDCMVCVIQRAIEIVKGCGVDTVTENETDANADSKWTEMKWIPVKWHEITEKEKASGCYSDDITYIFDCAMPEDGEDVIVTDGKKTWTDIACIDDWHYLESGYDWRDITAWLQLPEPYKGGLGNADRKPE